VQGLRRSVRATLSAKKKKKKPTPGPIAAASVMTPKSLLKREMTFGGEQQQDESLLFSPAANPAPRTTLPPPRRAAAAARQTSEKKVPRRGRSAPTDAEKATAPNSARVDAKKSSLRTEVEKENAVNKACATVDSRDAKAKQPVNIATRIRRTCAPRPRLTERTRVNQRQGVSRKPAVGPDKTQQEPPTTEKKDPVELVAANNPTNRQPRKNSPPASETRSVKTVKTVHPLPATVTKPTTKTVATGRPPDTGPIRDSPETVSSRHHWSSSMPASALHASRAVATPFTTRGNGVCMDLSDIFFDAAVKSSVKRPPPVVPGTHRRPRRDLHRSAMKPKNPVTQQIEQEDAQWADKQCETFSKWLNYTFQPNEDKDHEQEQGVDRTAFRTLVLHQRLAQARLGALEVFNGDDMNKVRAIVLSEINRGRIAVRKDRDMKADLTMRNQITTLLLQYSTPWLRLGLETLFGEAILPEQPIQFSPRGGKPTGASRKPPHCRMKLALKNFIVQRVISDEKVLAKYTNGKCLVPSGKFEVQYRAELRTLVLFRLLVLFIFLDRAKMKNVLDKAPRLFCKGSFVKSTRDVLLSFCRDFLKAEGDFVKHLSRVGLKVFYKQDQLDELDFEIENLATDLRDGVRLVRMTEILTGAAPKSMLARLRLPATSRLQKLHNVGLALKGLAEFGVPISSDLAAHHIVDGHREMVLKLMWSVVAHCCLSNLVDVERVKAEIERLTKSRSKTMQGDDELTSLLVQWCDAVCSRFGRSVKDLTRDLADGKATCYLIHYYHPTLLRRSDIKQTSKDLPASGPPPSKDTVTILLANERSNAFLANKRMAELGGIPAMVPICDATNPPDEKTMLLCIAFMCSRLLESNMENRACLLIQNCYRKHLSRILLKRKKVAASKILATWRTNREAYFRAQRQKYGSAVSVIESFVASRRVILSDLRRRRLARERTYLAAALLQVRKTKTTKLFSV
jgi:abnormal spindle-like microcephaly-associated protein